MQISSRAYMGAETLVRQRIDTEHSVRGLATLLESRAQCHLLAHYRPRLPIRPWTFAEVP